MHATKFITKRRGVIPSSFFNTAFESTRRLRESRFPTQLLKLKKRMH